MNTQSVHPAPVMALVRTVRDLRWSEIPADAREAARHCLLDFLGCALAGSHQPSTNLLFTETVVREGSSEASLIGRRERCSRLTASLVNGVAGHAHDLDAVHLAMRGHPTMPVIPAALALAETLAASGRMLLEAIVIGIELECRLAAFAGAEHDPTELANGGFATFGAAAACAHLLRLDEDGWLRAIGLADIQTGGLKSKTGAIAASLGAGRAAYDGLLGALAARTGYPAGTAALEAGLEFLSLPAIGPARMDGTDTSHVPLMIQQVLFKYHASSFLTHAPIDAAARVQMEHHVDPRTIDEVELQVSPDAIRACNIGAPTIGAEAKISLSATVAMALRGEDTANPGSFSTGLVQNRMQAALRERVRVVPVEGMPPTQARVIVTAAGRRFEADSDSGEPASDLDLQRQIIKRKFMTLSSPLLGEPAARDLERATLDAEDIRTVSELMRLTAPGHFPDGAKAIASRFGKRPGADNAHERSGERDHTFVALDEILGGALWPRHASRPRVPHGVSSSFRAPVRRH